jgi:hypothetical protein
MSILALTRLIIAVPFDPVKPSFDTLTAGGASLRASRRARRRGVALVVTLIMLAIITFMAVTFLVLSQRERTSVNGATDMKLARNASDAGIARGSTELLTRMLLQSNFADFDLLVSTNYINVNGFDNNGLPPDPTNVNYDYGVGAAHPSYASDRAAWEHNISDLLYNPRPPVFVVTNRGTGAGEFRYYLDLNRNGRFDKNGNWPVVVTDNGGNPVYIGTNIASGQIVTVPINSPVPATDWLFTNSFAGDPEWIGVLERPNELHSADNKFIARYAYLIVPVGKTLDVNYAHNRAKRISNTGEGFLRNQGVGTWEINLAGFLADLNTNGWWNLNNYVYQLNSAVPSTGAAFTNANDLLSYRYGPTGYPVLSQANTLFPFGGAALAAANIDAYSDGPLMLGTSNNASVTPDNRGFAWSGADNPNHFFSQQDLFDVAKLPPSLRTTMMNLGTSNDSYNAYTFYRLLAQLGTDSSPDRGKINVNFKNTDNSGNVVPGMETNLIAWTPTDFFTNAANAMFKQMNLTNFFDGKLVTVTNIPIYEDPLRYGGTNINYYTPAVHRVLQLAANMYDATTNRFIGSGPTNYPSVFRPFFRSQDGIVSIAGYVEVKNSLPAFLPFLNASDFVRAPQLNLGVNLYGVPWVIGAKKGFPNFNEFSMENPLTISRKLQFTNNTPNPPWTTNQIFDFSITNSFGFEAWNSYTNAYGRPLQLVVSNELSITLTNQLGFALLNVTNLAFGTNLTYSSWPGWTEGFSDSSFQVPLFVSQTYTNGIYTPSVVYPLAPPVWSVTFAPHLWMELQFKMQFILIDTSVNRVIDFVNLVSTQPVVDVTSTLQGGNSQGDPNDNPDAQWDTRFLSGATGISEGIYNQIQASSGAIHESDWNDTPVNIAAAQSLFRKRLNNSVTNNFQAPYTPERTIYQRISWQANDPLVHYTVQDLTSTNGTQAQYNLVELNAKIPPLPNLTNLNYAFQPWGGYHLPPFGNQQDNNENHFDFNWQLKDPMVQQSDNWDFPTNKLPNIGWLGRIHRGTPWQTVFMKPAGNMTVDTWRKWNNDNEFFPAGGTNLIASALMSHPTADYGLFDLFTTAINENASHGRLDVNQTNLAPWSAVLSGVNVLTNSVNGLTGPALISPAGVYDPTQTNISVYYPTTTNIYDPATAVARIWRGINETRANTDTTNNLVFLNHTFQHAGDVLATPELTVESPFLYTEGIPNNKASGLASLNANGINDEVMERIPQQIMSLLTLNSTPRFVIYSFGQTLHPADHSLVIGGQYNGLCTNYQITAESATRAVVRVEGSPDPQYTDYVTNGVSYPHPDPQGRFYPPHLVVEQFNVLGPD